QAARADVRHPPTYVLQQQPTIGERAQSFTRRRFPHAHGIATPRTPPCLAITTQFRQSTSVHAPPRRQAPVSLGRFLAQQKPTSGEARRMPHVRNVARGLL